MAGLNMDFTPNTDQNHANFDKDQVWIAAPTVIRKIDTDRSQIELIFNYDNSVAKELLEKFTNEGDENAWDHALCNTTTIFDGGYTYVNASGNTIIEKNGVIGMKPGARLCIKPKNGHIKKITFYHDFAYSNLNGTWIDDYDPSQYPKDVDDSKFWNDNLAKTNLIPINSFDDPTQRDDINISTGLVNKTI